MKKEYIVYAFLGIIFFSVIGFGSIDDRLRFISFWDQDLNTTSNVTFFTITASNICYSNGTQCTASGNSSGSNGNITGSLASNYIPRASNGSNLVNSVINQTGTEIHINATKVLIGTNARGLATGSVAFGDDSISASIRSYAIGYQANATGLYSMAIGRQSRTALDYATAIGFQSNASGYGSLAIGYRPTSTGIYSMSIGSNVNSLANRSIVIGYGNTLDDRLTNNNPDSLVIGFESVPILIVNKTAVTVNGSNGLCLGGSCITSFPAQKSTYMKSTPIDVNYTDWTGVSDYRELFRQELTAGVYDVDCYIMHYTNKSSNGLRASLSISPALNARGELISQVMHSSSTVIAALIPPYGGGLNHASTTGATLPQSSYVWTTKGILNISDTVNITHAVSAEEYTQNNTVNILRDSMCIYRQI